MVKHLNAKSFPDVVKSVNEKGETPLHVAVCNRELNPVLPLLLKRNSDVNARNFWNQTPLHYACENHSIEAITHLLSQPGLVVNTRDLNGYNALLSYVWSTESLSKEWIKGFEILLQHGADVNSQSYFGNGILHLASGLKSEEVVEYILQNNEEIQWNLQNCTGQTFLHSFVTYTGPSYCIKLFDLLHKRNPLIFVKVLNQKDILGQSPWFRLITTRLPEPEICLSSIKLGGQVHSTDCLGNTVLHLDRITNNISLFNTLVHCGASVNAPNIYGFSPLSVVQLVNPEVCDAVVRLRGDFGMKDRWGRSTFLAMLNVQQFPQHLERIFTEYSVDINCQDMFGTTPLHLAAYNNDVRSVKVLLSHKPNTELIDNEGNRALETALKHGNFKCYKIISGYMHETIHNDLELYTAPSYVSLLSLLRNENDLSLEIPDLPENKYKYSVELLARYHVMSGNESDEAHTVSRAVGQLVHKVCDLVAEFDERFRMSVLPTGSAAEGTKVGRPDEFDFALCIETLAEKCDIEMSNHSDFEGFACLKFRDSEFKQNSGSSDRGLPDVSRLNIADDKGMRQFADEELFFTSNVFLKYLFRYIQKALFQTEHWKTGNLGFMGDFCVLNEKPVMNFTAFWVGSVYKYLEISIDLVPVVYKRGWWPHAHTLKDAQLSNDNVKNAGCFVLLQTKERDFKVHYDVMHDMVGEFARADQEYKKHEMRSYRVSVAPAEITLIKSLPERFRKGYALAKIMKGDGITPRISVDIAPKAYKEGRSNPIIVKPSHEIKSYWLKNCMFYVAETSLEKHETPFQIATTIYNKLLECVEACSITPYLLRYSDVFEFEKDKKLSLSELRGLLVHRKVCIDMMRCMFGYSFPVSNAEWLASCENNYRRLFKRQDESFGKLAV